MAQHSLAGEGGIAVNSNRTLLAVAGRTHVSLFEMSKMGRIVPPSPVIVFGETQLRDARHICFAVETVLVVDAGNHCIEEFSTSGAHLQRIQFAEVCQLVGIAYAATGGGGIIAVSVTSPVPQVVLLDSATAVVLRYVGDDGTILRCPTGVRFSRDGHHILVADRHNHRVSKFRVDSGEFVSHVATWADGIAYPHDFLVCGDGDGQRDGIIVACRPFDFVGEDCSRIIALYEDGSSTEMGLAFGVVAALAWMPAGSCYKVVDAGLFVMPCEWCTSLRGVWVTACVCV
jgi:hypothetical protein